LIGNNEMIFDEFELFEKKKFKFFCVFLTFVLIGSRQ